MPKVKKINAPILVLGLGGTGFDMLMRVKSEFRRRFEGEKFPDGSEASHPPRTEYCEIDTQSSIGREVKYGLRLDTGEFVDIGGSFDMIKQAIGDRSYVREWLDQSLVKADIEQDGAGCYRQVSRLALFYNYTQVRQALSGKLRVLAAVNPEMAEKSKRISVKIMAGISGGTGSGLLLDIAYILRDIARQGGYSINIEAYLMMPDVTIDHAAGEDTNKRKLYSINSYALLKELDYWMDAEQTGIRLVQKYSDTESVTWMDMPFNDVYLLCSKNDHGADITDSYSHNIDSVAEYLVHCYESSDALGEESFELVREKDGAGEKSDAYDGGAASTNDSFGFQSAHSNQDAIVNVMHHPFPVPTRYHSLGAFSNAGEDRLMEVQEWSMIYDETVARFDAHKAVMGGQDPVDFQRSVLSLDKPVAATASAEVRAEFEKRHPIPDLEGCDYDSLKRQDASSAPHGTLYANYKKSLDNSRGDEDIKVSEKVWTVFLDQARAVGQDIKRGPEFLYALLSEGQRSLTVALPKYIETIKNLKSQASQGMDDEMESCKVSFDRFMHPTVWERLTLRALYDDYMTKVSALYDSARADAYYAALLVALDDFTTKLKAYTAILGDMVGAIKKQRDTYHDELRKAESAAVTALFDTGAMRRDLTAIFQDEIRRDTIVQSLYTNVIGMVEKLMKLNWTKDELVPRVNEAIDALRENQFVGVGGMSLTRKIMTYQKVGEGPALQDYVEKRLCDKLMNGAEVMFYPSSISHDLPSTIAAHTCMISLPDGSPDIEAGIRAFCKHNHLLAIIKHTLNSDRIFWVNDKGGLPMYYYGFIDILRGQYVQYRMDHKAYHLFMNDNPRAINGAGRLDEMKQKWESAVPDPVISRNEREIGKRSEQLKKAEEQGVLRLEYSFPYDDHIPTVKVVKSVFRKIGGVNVSRKTISDALAAIPFDQNAVEELQKLEPIEANEPALNKGLEDLKGYRDAIVQLDGSRDEAEVKFSHLYHAAVAWGETLNIQESMMNLNPGMAPAQEAEVKDAWKRAYGRAIREALSRRPDLVAELEDHASFRELIAVDLAKADALIEGVQAKIEAIPHKDEGQLLSDCKDVAHMIMYKQIDVKNVKVCSTVISGPAADLYYLDDSHPELERMFECFIEYPILLQFAAWYSAVGKNAQGAIDITMRKVAEMRDAIRDKSGPDPETDAIKATAGSWRTELDKVRQKVMLAYADHALTRGAYELCISMIDAIDREFSRFIRTW